VLEVHVLRVLVDDVREVHAPRHTRSSIRR
jgi:hypothetical protein